MLRIEIWCRHEQDHFCVKISDLESKTLTLLSLDLYLSASSTSVHALQFVGVLVTL